MPARRTFAAGFFAAILFLTYFLARAAVEDAAPGAEQVGPTGDGGWIMPTGQRVRPAGESLAFPGRPVGLVLGRGGTLLYVKNNRGLLVIDTAQWKPLQNLPFPGTD